MGAWLPRIRNYLYDKEFLTIEKFPYFVISVGNLTWGGTGKTTLTAQIGRFLLSRGRRVAVVSRGYGRTSHGIRVVNSPCADWQELGDELFLLSQQLPEATIVAAEDRRSGLRALSDVHPDVVLLDDAFQHRRAARNLDLVLIDASENINAQKVIPWGKLREPASGIKRADAAVLTHAAEAHPETVEWIASEFHGPVFCADYAFTNSESWNGKSVAAFCALGAPHHFFRMLKESGATLVLGKAFRDHHAYSQSDVDSMAQEASRAGAVALVTTQKDAVKLKSFSFTLPLVVAAAQLRFEKENAFFEFLQRQLEARTAGPSPGPNSRDV